MGCKADLMSFGMGELVELVLVLREVLLETHEGAIPNAETRGVEILAVAFSQA